MFDLILDTVSNLDSIPDSMRLISPLVATFVKIAIKIITNIAAVCTAVCIHDWRVMIILRLSISKAVILCATVIAQGAASN